MAVSLYITCNDCTFRQTFPSTGSRSRWQVQAGRRPLQTVQVNSGVSTADAGTEQTSTIIVCFTCPDLEHGTIR